jgi:hypothetical protein
VSLVFPFELLLSVSNRGDDLGGAFLVDRATRLGGFSGLEVLLGRFLVRVLLRMGPVGGALARGDDSPVATGALNL